MAYDIRTTDPWWSYDETPAFNDNHHVAGRDSTTTISTACSSNSEACISDDSFRFSRAPSLASSCTSYSSSSQLLTASYFTSPTRSHPPAPAHLQTHAPLRQTIKQKQASNPYACSHCDFTFSKRADRKKHILKTCPYFGSEFLCPQCTHISRNKYQAAKHQKDFQHEAGPCEAITFSKHALTCSNDGKLYRNLDEYLEHFSTSNCILNSFDGNRKHISRLRTLLSEGRATTGGHTYVYAALILYCSQHGLTMNACNAIIDAIPPSDAQRFAERLEWGYYASNGHGGSARARLGYTDFEAMVSQIMAAGITRIRTQQQQEQSRSAVLATTPVIVSSSSDNQDPNSNLLGSHVPSTESTSVRIRRKHIPIDPINTSRPLYPSHPPAPPPKDCIHKGLRDSPAVAAATAMLRGHGTNSSAHNNNNNNHAQKRSQPLDSPFSPQPSSRRNAQNNPKRNSGGDTLSDDAYPEKFSLTPTPPLTARNLAYAAMEVDDEEDMQQLSVKQKRQAGIWEISWFDDFILYNDDASDNDVGNDEAYR